MEDIKVSIKEGKEEKWYKTDILDEFDDGFMTELYSEKRNGEDKRLYKVLHDSVTYILKAITVRTSNEKAIKEEEEKYNSFVKCEGLCTDIAKLLDYKTVIKNNIKEITLEALFEYGGTNILQKFSKATAKEVMEVMKQVASIIQIIEANGGFHSDFGPESIVFKDGQMKIADHGLVKAKGKSAGLEYCPPEVHSDVNANYSKAHVYSWGMMLYQLMTGKTLADLRDELPLRSTEKDYPKFMDKILHMRIEGGETIKELVVRVLLRTLSFNPKERPSFAELKEILASGGMTLKDEVEHLRILLKKAEFERDEARIDVIKTVEEKNRSIEEKAKRIKDLEEEIEKYKIGAKLILKCKNVKEAEWIELKGKIPIQDYIDIARNYEEAINYPCDDINFTFCNLGDLGASIIAKEFQSLRYLMLGFCRIGVEGAKELVKGLSNNDHVIGLYMGYHWKSFKDWGNVHTIPSLEASNCLRTEGTKVICEWLEKSPWLEYLDLSYCNIGAGALSSMTVLVNSTKRLHCLSIKENKELAEQEYLFKDSVQVEY